jgi:hypothetical protein
MDEERKKEVRLELESRNKQALGWREQLGDKNVKHIEGALSEAQSIAESLSETLYWGGQLYINAGDFATMMEHIRGLHNLIKIEDVPEHLQ